MCDKRFELTLGVRKMASIKVKLTESILKNIPLEITKINDTEISGFYLNVGKTNKEGQRSQVDYLYQKMHPK
jgi:hypothetical protein